MLAWVEWLNPATVFQWGRAVLWEAPTKGRPWSKPGLQHLMPILLWLQGSWQFWDSSPTSLLFPTAPSSLWNSLLPFFSTLWRPASIETAQKQLPYPLNILAAPVWPVCIPVLPPKCTFNDFLHTLGPLLLFWQHIHGLSISQLPSFVPNRRHAISLALCFALSTSLFRKN